ncbi:MAG: shikimate dehydrogenase [Alphaproteobacteria bacterium]|nr:shikimate dehydrogenase [Alphaproteobacteria bacterium]MBV9152607.1 shikimate dehydrogenase [Alphaproteobacteria bacterium]
MRITGRTKLAGIMAWPVSHSRSPAVHNFWIDEHGIDGAYVPLAVRPEHLAQALRALPALGFRGCNLTLPHKQAALAIVDRLEPMARRIGAINTIIVAADGSLEGRNTDAFGFRENLRDRAPDWKASAGPAVVLGAGGAARGVVAALIEAKVEEIRIVNRTLARAERLASDLASSTTRLTVLPWNERDPALRGCRLLVNTTSLGTSGEAELEIDLQELPPAAVVADIVYVPLETPLLAAARQRGNRTVDGLGMLLHQGRPGFEAWFGSPVQVTRELRAAVLTTLGGASGATR